MDVFITNSGSSAINGWTLEWTFPDPEQVITRLWSGSYTQNRQSVQVTNVPWNGNIAPGATEDFGFILSWTNANPSPTAFTLNGVPSNTP